MRVLALGDSYTIGEGVSPAERWPAQLAERLGGLGLRVDELVILAQTGWTTEDLLARIAEEKPAGPFDLVTLLIGVNNQYQGLPLAAYREEFRALLRQAITLAADRAERVLVLSIPDWSVTPYAEGKDRLRIAAEIDAFNQANRAETEDAGARYVDITLMTRQRSIEPGWLAEDGLHPAANMYAAWVEMMMPAVLNTIG